MPDKTVVGVFTSRPKAEEAVEELRKEGFTENEISIVAKDEGKGREGRGQGNRSGEGAMTGANVGDGTAWGGALGAGAGLLASAGALAIPGIGPILAAGPLAATLSGAVTGGIAGGLLDWGIPEERGRHFEQRVKRGDVLCAIRTSEGKTDKAKEIMKRKGAQEVETH